MKILIYVLVIFNIFISCSFGKEYISTGAMKLDSILNEGELRDTKYAENIKNIGNNEKKEENISVDDKIKENINDDIKEVESTGDGEKIIDNNEKTATSDADKNEENKNDKNLIREAITNNLVIGNENKENNNQSIKKEGEFFPYEEEYYSPFNSFMFTTSNFNLLKKVLGMYNKNKLNMEKKTIVEINEDTGEKEEIEYDKNIGNVYLKSIMYISKNFWTVWINDKKISNLNNSDPDNEFVITKLNRNEANIKWVVSKNKWNMINYENNIHINDYKINEETNKVEFNMFLHPNQTFVASKNEVVDGRFKEEKEKIIDHITEENLDFMLNDGDIDFDLLINN